MAKIKVTNPKQIINGGAKKYYFKVKGVGGIKGDKGDKGDTGSQGPQGPQGNAATIEVGSTTTLPTGYDATVTNTGTINNAILNFGIPRGIKGDTGAKGDKGDKGDKGEQGNTGPQGPAGQNATVYVGTTTTGAPGTQASVYNSGTDRNAVLNFTIPQGATGATGATGPQGPAGQDGQNFTPTIVETLPATGDQSKLYLTPKTYTTGTASGNPITISLGEDAGQITSFQLDGDTFQQTYTGKNLIATTRAKETKNGVTCTWNGASFTLDGTTTASTDFYGRGWWGATSDPIVLPAGTYTMSLRKSDGSLATDANFSVDCYYGTTHIIGIYRGNSGAGFSTVTFDSDTQYSVFYISLDSGKTYNNEKFYVQLEKSESPTPYEPFVGGQASPSPAYPQQIQTVTGEQTVEIVGKNLFDKNNVTENSVLEADGALSFNTTDYSTSALIPVKPSTTYYKSRTNSVRFKFYDAKQEPTSSVYTDIPTAGNAQSFATPSDCYYVRFTFKKTLANTVQLELGSTASSYAPYSKQTLPLDLGSIELNGLGDDGAGGYLYKDGIYANLDDNKWYLHKETGKYVYNNDLGENGIGSTYVAMLTPTLPTLPNMAFTDGLFWCNSYTPTMRNNTGLQGTNASGRIRVNTSLNIASSYAQVRALAAANNLTIHYPLATATDTEITNTTLIAQLEAVLQAKLQASNTITNTATGSNLAGDMELGYCEYDPQNRYDKWLWLGLNNNYEKLGS